MGKTTFQTLLQKSPNTLIMKYIIYICFLLTCSIAEAQQKIDPDFFTPKSDGLMRYTEMGETYMRRVIADGWFTDTSASSRNVYRNPYESLSSSSQKEMNDQHGFVFYKYSKGKRCNGTIIDSVYYSKNNAQPFFKGTYNNGLLEGKTEMYFTKSDGISENGKLKSTGNFENGEVVGEWVNYLRSGEIRDKFYYAKNIKFVRKVISYFKDGSIDYISEFLENGTRKYMNTFYTNGKIWSSKILTDNNKEGLMYSYIEYFLNGHIKTKGRIKETNMSSDKIGIWEVYTEDGKRSIINYN